MQDMIDVYYEKAPSIYHDLHDTGACDEDL